MRRILQLDTYFCGPEMPIRDAMARINETEHLFQLVVDHEHRLLGTLTDGDIRRALLRDVTLGAPVEECMHTDYLAGQADAEPDNLIALSAGKRLVTFLPLVDGRGRVVEVLLHEAGEAGIAQALVMAGGFGRRLGERTKSTPKSLLPVGDRPILDHVLSALEQAGIGQVHVAVHHMADQIKSFVSSRPNQAEIRFIEEDAPLGTAGALGRLPAGENGPVLVVNGDVLTGVDYAALDEFHQRHAFDATVGVARYDVEVPFGVVRYDDDGLFAGIEEKPRVSNFVAAGVYYLGPEFTALVPRDKLIDMPELLTLGRQIGLKIGLFPIHEYWTDIGRPGDLDAADAAHAAGDARGASVDSLGALEGVGEGRGGGS